MSSSKPKPVRLKTLVAKSERLPGETAAQTQARQAACKHGDLRFLISPGGTLFVQQCKICGKALG